MAVASKDIPVTREQAQGWLTEYDQQNSDDSKLRDFLMGKVDALELDNVMVDTSGRDDYSEDEVHVVDLLMDDLGSYARYKKPAA
jgi:hypothetical protein